MNLFMFMTETGTTAANNPLGSLIMPLILVAVFVVLFILMNRSQKKQEKEAAKMRDELAIGDEITTIGGIIGQIVSIKGETVTIVTSKDKTKIRFLKTAIRNVDVKANGEVPSKKENAPPVNEIQETNK